MINIGEEKNFEEWVSLKRLASPYLLLYSGSSGEVAEQKALMIGRIFMDAY
jgi:hypothetical protein